MSGAHGLAKADAGSKDGLQASSCPDAGRLSGGRGGAATKLWPTGPKHRVWSSQLGAGRWLVL